MVAGRLPAVGSVEASVRRVAAACSVVVPDVRHHSRVTETSMISPIRRGPLHQGVPPAGGLSPSVAAGDRRPVTGDGSLEQ